MLNKLIKLFWIKISVALLFCFIVFGIPYFWANQIAKEVKLFLKNNYQSDLSYNSVSINLYQHFPNLTLKLNDPQLLVPYFAKKDTIFKSKETLIVLDIPKLLSGGGYEIKTLALINPNINIKIAKSGLANYQVFIKKDSSSVTKDSQSVFSFKIDKIKFQNAHIKYKDAFTKNVFEVSKAHFEGNLDIEGDSILSNFNLIAPNIYYKNSKRVILNNDQININTDFYYLSSAKKIFSSDTKVSINGLDLDVKGGINLSDSDSIYTDVKVNAKDVPIHFLGAFLPKSYAKHLKNADSDGSLYIDAYCKGAFYMAKNIIPLYSLKANIKDAKLKLTEIAMPIHDINLDIECYNDSIQRGTHNFMLNKISASAGEDFIKGFAHFRVDKSVKIESNLNLGLDLKDFRDYFKSDSVFAEGRIEANSTISGYYDSKKGVTPSFNCNLNIEKGKLKYAHLPDSISDINVKLSLENKTASLDNTFISADSLSCMFGKDLIKGSFRVNNLKNPDIACDLKTNLSLDEIQKFYPLEGMNIKGNAEISLKAEGKLDFQKKIFPKTFFSMKLKDGNIKNEMFEAPIENIYLFADLVNYTGKLSDTRINIYKLSFKTEENQFSAYGLVKDLDSPNFDLLMKGNIDIQHFTNIFKLKYDLIKGKIKSDIQIKLAWNDIISKDYSKITLIGMVSGSDLIYEDEHNHNNFKIDNFKILLSPEKIKIEQFKGHHPDGEFSLKGSIGNYIPYFVNNQKLKVDMVFSTKELHLNRYYHHNVPSSDTSSFKFSSIENIDLNLQTFIKKLYYDSLKIENLNGGVLVKKNKIILSETGMESVGGSLFFSGFIDFNNPSKPQMEAKMDIKQINIKKAFSVYNALNNIKEPSTLEGNISIKYKLNIPMNAKFDFDPKSINGVGSMAINNLKMAGHKVFNKVSKLTNKKQISDANIDDIEIKSEVREGKMYYNPFKMKVSGFDTDVEGFHGFAEGNMYYILKIAIPPFDVVKIPIHITGNSDNPNVEFGKGDETVKRYIDSLSTIKVSDEEL